MVEVPGLQNIEKAFNFTIRMSNETIPNRTVFRFSNSKGCDPFPMLVVSSAIRYSRRRSGAKNCTAQNVDLNSYGHHMRFYTACGIQTDKTLEEDYGNSRYLPITKISISDLSAEGCKNYQNIQEIINQKACQMASVLCQCEGLIKEQLSYILRELIRNIPEHSGADEIWFCAQYWPSYDFVELAILDEGMGIFNSLHSNKIFGSEINDCETAIDWAVRPGISTSFEEKDRSYKYDDWQNTGYGLYIVKELCKRLGGSLIIASGDIAKEFNSENTKTYKCQLHGTAICVRLHPTQILNSENLIEAIKRQGETEAKSNIHAFVFASKASGNLHRGSF